MIVAVQTRKARAQREKRRLVDAREKGFDGRAPIWERRIPAYDAKTDPYCRLYHEAPPDPASTMSSGLVSAPPRDARPILAEAQPAGAPAEFASICAACDFEPHEGTDPHCQLAVLKAILSREAALAALEALCEDVARRAHRSWALREPPKPLDQVTRREAADAMSALRDRTLELCEALLAWRGDTDVAEAKPFLWHGRDYALKVASSDSDFVAAVEPLAAALGVDARRMRRNPLMLPRTLDDAHVAPPTGEQTAKGARFAAAEAFLVAEEVRAGKGITAGDAALDDDSLPALAAPAGPQSDALRSQQARALRAPAETSWAGGGIAARHGSLPPAAIAPVSLAHAADAGWGSKKTELVNWREQASDQLANLADRGENAARQAATRRLGGSARGTVSQRSTINTHSTSSAPGHPLAMPRRKSTSRRTKKGDRRGAPAPQLGAPTPTLALPDDDAGSYASDDDVAHSAPDAAVKAAAHAAAAARTVEPADLSTLAGLDAPKEAVALVAAAALTLAAGGGAGVPGDVRWPAFVEFVDADAAGVASSLRALDCSAVADFKRRALRRFLDAAAPAASGAQTPGGPADAAAARLHAWVASALAAADAAAHARAGDDEAAGRALAAAAAAARRARRVRARRPPSKRRARTPASPNQTGPRSPSRGAPPASLAADVVVTSKLRDRFGPDPRRSSGQREAWLVSVVAKPDGSFEARAYHPGTSVELSLAVPRAAAPAGKNPDRWAADVLPSKLVLDMGSGRPELVLRSTSPTRRR